jgi:Virulence-associated protein E-like domain
MFVHKRRVLMTAEESKKLIRKLLAKQRSIAPLAKVEPKATGESEQLTILQCNQPHLVATKRWYPPEEKGGEPKCKSYSEGMKYFSVEQKAILSIRELGKAVDSIADVPNAFVIRGVPLPDTDLENTKRRSRSKPGEPATFIEPEGGRHWVCLDIDGAEAPNGVSFIEEPIVCIKHVIAQLPGMFHRATCFYQLTASAGVPGKEGVRAHLWFWLNKRVTDRQLKIWMKRWSFKVDLTMFGTVQPHYVAPPFFARGIDDPFLKNRTEFIEGESEVVCVDEVDFSITGDELSRWKQYAEKKLATGVKEIKKLCKGEARHPVVNRVAFGLGQLVPELLDENTVYEALCIAAEENKHAFDVERLEALKREIESGISDGMEQPQNYLAGWKCGILMSKGKGAPAPLPNIGNIKNIIARHPDWEGLVGYNARKQTACFVKQPMWATDADDKLPRTIQDSDAVEAAAWFTSVIRCPASAQVCYESMLATAHKALFDPFEKHLESISWDGIERLDEWLITTAGAEDTPYTRAVGRKFIISIVARTYRPGSKVDTVMILEGDQGIGKSRLLCALVGDDFFTDNLEDLKNKDARIQLCGPVIVELAELDALNNKESTAIKAFLSTRVDKFRPPYGRSTVSNPRRCVFAGTTNKSSYLKDETGARRFWPIAVGQIDLELLEDQKDQLLAEAVSLYNSDEQWWLTEEEEKLAQAEQELRRVETAFDSPVMEYLGLSLSKSKPYVKGLFLPKTIEKDYAERFDDDGMRVWTTTQEVKDWAFPGENNKWSDYDQSRIGKTLKANKWKLRHPRTGPNGKRERRYYRPGTSSVAG